MINTLEAGHAARRLLRRHQYGVLSTYSREFKHYPYGSFVDYVTDHFGRPVILISALAEHTHNVNAHPKVSLAVHDPGRQSQALPRLTLLGEAKLMSMADMAVIRTRYLRYFPEAGQYLDLDFAFYRIEPQHQRYIGGFAQALWVNATDFLSLSSRLESMETSIIQHMNTDHVDALQVFCQNCVHAGGTPQMIGIDCDGFDLRQGDQIHRVEFDGLARDADTAREQILALAARHKPA